MIYSRAKKLATGFFVFIMLSCRSKLASTVLIYFTINHKRKTKKMYLLYFAVLNFSLNLYKGIGAYSSFIHNMSLSKQLYSFSCISMNVASMIKDVLIILEESM